MPRQQMHVNNLCPIIDDTRSALIKNRDQNDNNNSESASSGASAGLNTMSETSDDSSLNSIELEPIIGPVDGGTILVDSDTGLESMSSAETSTKLCLMCKERSQSSKGTTSKNLAALTVENLRQEITRLKCDKLDLLRHNVVIFVETFFI